MKLVPIRDRDDRKEIERIWREVMGKPPTVELAASREEWAFFLALLRRKS